MTARFRLACCTYPLLWRRGKFKLSDWPVDAKVLSKCLYQVLKVQWKRYRKLRTLRSNAARRATRLRCWQGENVGTIHVRRCGLAAIKAAQHVCSIELQKQVMLMLGDETTTAVLQMLHALLFTTCAVTVAKVTSFCLYAD